MSDETSVIFKLLNLQEDPAMTLATKTLTKACKIQPVNDQLARAILAALLNMHPDRSQLEADLRGTAITDELKNLWITSN